MAKRSSKPSPAHGPRQNAACSLEEMVGDFAGRSIYPASSYREPAPGADGTAICGGCAVDCCSTQWVPLSVVDAHAIRVALGLPYAAFATLVPRPSYAPTWPVRTERGAGMLALKRLRGHCILQLRFGRQHRCGAYAVRPMACHLFPFVPDADAQKRAPVGMLAQRPPRDCPWHWPVTEAASQQISTLISQNTERQTIDAQLLRTWHRQLDLPHTVAHFFAFLDEEMARRARGEQGPGRWRTRLW